MMAILLLGALFVGAQDRPGDAPADLSAAKALYLSASYEEALDRLTRIVPTDALRDEVETYKALCMLALGRIRESERLLEQVLMRNPQYVLNEDAVSPRLVTVFRGVRSRLLPTKARSLYALAKTNFNEGKYQLAVDQLKEVLTIVGGDDGDTVMGDLRLVTEEFLRLAEARLAPPPDLEGNGRLSISRVSLAGAVLYAIADRGVIAPVEISRPVPRMETPRGTRPGTYQGTVEVVIDEKGRVVHASIVTSITPAYDAEVLRMAVDTWRFQPATRNGQPVKYRRAYEVIVHSR